MELDFMTEVKNIRMMLVRHSETQKCQGLKNTFLSEQVPTVLCSLPYN